ncbi:ERF family protein [Campylobacter showae]|uniref:ERF family protein n=1 Tax=Campylobacter showae TaxID=204 RepID=UPI0028ECF521|nr:ERF family protein [Campylobacter showae]
MIETLSKIQCELKAPKSQFNKFGGYSYRSCEDITEAVKPLLEKYGVALTISDEITQVASRIYVKATATLRGKDGEISVAGFAREAETKKGMDESQITGSASSYARKYALNGLFAIDDTKDADATNTHDDETRQNKQPTFLNADQLNDLGHLCEITNTNPDAIVAAYKVKAFANLPYEKVRGQLLKKLEQIRQAQQSA